MSKPQVLVDKDYFDRIESFYKKGEPASIEVIIKGNDSDSKIQIIDWDTAISKEMRDQLIILIKEAINKDKVSPEVIVMQLDSNNLSVDMSTDLTIVDCSKGITQKHRDQIVSFFKTAISISDNHSNIKYYNELKRYSQKLWFKLLCDTKTLDMLNKEK